jgi:hypothetical protein
MGVTLSGTPRQTIAESQISISWLDLENLLRRVVREELSRASGSSARSILNDWNHEGADDPAGDATLMREAVAVLDKYGDKPDTWVRWEDFEAEIRWMKIHDTCCSCV